MSTHNICFRGEIRKIFTRYPPLSRPMDRHTLSFQSLPYFCNLNKSVLLPADLRTAG